MTGELDLLPGRAGSERLLDSLTGAAREANQAIADAVRAAAKGAAILPVDADGIAHQR